MKFYTGILQDVIIYHAKYLKRIFPDKDLFWVKYIQYVSLEDMIAYNRTLIRP